MTAGETLKLAETGVLPTGTRAETGLAPIGAAPALATRLPLSGAQLTEITQQRWSEVDFERGRLALPDSKTGAKIIYAPPMAFAFLSAVDRVARRAATGRQKPRRIFQTPPELDRRRCSLRMFA